MLENLKGLNKSEWICESVRRLEAAVQPRATLPPRPKPQAWEERRRWAAVQIFHKIHNFQTRNFFHKPIFFHHNVKLDILGTLQGPESPAKWWPAPHLWPPRAHFYSIHQHQTQSHLCWRFAKGSPLALVDLAPHGPKHSGAVTGKGLVPNQCISRLVPHTNGLKVGSKPGL